MSSASEPTRVGELAAVLVERVRGHYGEGLRADALAEALSGVTSDRRPVDPDLLREVEALAQTVFRHIELKPAVGLQPERHSPGWPPPDLAAIRRAGGGLESVLRDPDGRATIRLTGLAEAEAAAGLLAGAFAAVEGAETIVLDLRANGGGDPATVALIVDWLAGGPPRHLFDVEYRDRTRQWWTAGCPVAPRPNATIRVLIGPRTYSSGEALAWTLQDQQLATVVGQPSRGAADHVLPLALCHDVSAVIPEACVVAPGGGPTWEGIGVQPDVLLES